MTSKHALALNAVALIIASAQMSNGVHLAVKLDNSSLLR